MLPAPRILRPLHRAPVAAAATTPPHRLMVLPPTGPPRATFQDRTQSVLDFLANTLRKTW